MTKPAVAYLYLFVLSIENLYFRGTYESGRTTFVTTVTDEAVRVCQLDVSLREAILVVVVSYSWNQINKGINALKLNLLMTAAT